ncbi:MAG: TonB-dependent receptor [Ignavibacteria bacterium]|nr:TonB-dependent receptor [Ignavibacteria bacterium]
MRIFVITLLLPFFTTCAIAQTVNVKGRALQSGDASPLPGATVRFVSVKDTTFIRRSYTERDGGFSIKDMPLGAYKLNISAVGFRKLESTVFVRDGKGDLGVFRLQQDTVRGAELNVEATAIRMEVKGDTMDYNAQAFKTNPNATAEDLVKKMPGITVENGTVRAQGEEVRRVTVDGREFFADDAQATLRNLPADMVDRVQVFDRGSDLSMFSGFDDGNTSKQMNVVTRKDKRNGSFGRIYAGYGDQERYQGGGTINNFSGPQRVSLIGMANNINQQNFSFQDILGTMGGGGMSGGMGRMMSRYMSGGGSQMMMRMGGGGGPMGGFSNFFVGQQGGIAATSAIGANYSDQWGDRTNVSSSYLFNNANNDRTTDLNRQYMAAQNAGQVYLQRDTANTNSNNHRFNMRVESVLDSVNLLVVSPRVTFQGARSTSDVDGSTALNTRPLNTTNTRTDGNNGGYNASVSTTYRRLLSTNGRTIAVTLNVDGSNRWNDGSLASTNQFSLPLDSTFLFNQNSDGGSTSRTIGGQVAYTEPVGQRDMIQFSYEPSFSENDSRKTTRSLDTVTNTYALVDSLLSNNFVNGYSTQRAGALYRMRGDNTIITFGGSYQYALLSGEQTFPLSLRVERTFQDFLPSFMWQQKFSAASNIRLFYRTSTNAPSISQLQDVVDNSNPLQLRIGNPNLAQEYTHSVNARFVDAQWMQGKTMFGFVNVSYTQNYIGNAVDIIQRGDTTRQQQFAGIVVGPGTQVSRPVNLEGNWNLRSFFTYGFPVMGWNLNLNSGLFYTRTPGRINQQENFANSTTGNLGFFLSSAASEDLDVSISYNGMYTWVKNTTQITADDNYFSHIATARVIWNVGAIACSTDVNQTLYSGLGTEFNRSFTVWNAGIGYRFLENRAAELRLTVNDILNQNDAINRSVNDVSIDDTRTNALRRFAMVTFSYDLKAFTKQ